MPDPPPECSAPPNSSHRAVRGAAQRLRSDLCGGVPGQGARIGRDRRDVEAVVDLGRTMGGSEPTSAASTVASTQEASGRDGSDARLRY